MSQIDYIYISTFDNIYRNDDDLFNICNTNNNNTYIPPKLLQNYYIAKSKGIQDINIKVIKYSNNIFPELSLALRYTINPYIIWEGEHYYKSKIVALIEKLQKAHKFKFVSNSIGCLDRIKNVKILKPKYGYDNLPYEYEGFNNFITIPILSMSYKTNTSNKIIPISESNINYTIDSILKNIVFRNIYVSDPVIGLNSNIDYIINIKRKILNHNLLFSGFIGKTSPYLLNNYTKIKLFKELGFQHLIINVFSFNDNILLAYKRLLGYYTNTKLLIKMIDYLNSANIKITIIITPNTPHDNEVTRSNNLVCIKMLNHAIHNVIIKNYNDYVTTPHLGEEKDTFSESINKILKS